MDGFETLKGVQVLAATNRPQTLDAALMRPGRFDAHVYLGPPDLQARYQIFEINTRLLRLPASLLSSLSQRTEGYSGAETVRICNIATDAAIERVIAEGGQVAEMGALATEEDFDRAIAQTPKGITKDMLAGYESFARGGD